MNPAFRRKTDGSLVLQDTRQATIVRAEQRHNKYVGPQKNSKVRTAAIDDLKKAGGDPTNNRDVLGFYRIQFGQFRGETFRWVVENSPGYAGYLVGSIVKEKARDENPDKFLNKMAFKKYVESFPEGMEIISRKTKGPSKAAASTSATTATATVTGVSSQPTLQTVVPFESRPSKAAASTSATTATATVTGVSSQPTLQTVVPFESSDVTDFADDDNPELLAAVEQMEQTMTVSQATTKTRSPRSLTKEATSVEDLTDVCLPAGWKTTLPKVDHNWVSKTFFVWKKNTGKTKNEALFLSEKINKLWWYPPAPSAAPTAIPKVDRYFAHPLLFWMPRKLWKAKFVCPHPECLNRELTSAGLYQKVRHVVDVDGSYNVASEYLVCNKCQHKYIAWSHAVISQLDLGHRCQLPFLLTAKLACDIKVVRLLRSRGLGNSSSQIQKKLEEQHSEAWMEKLLQFLTDCQGFSRAAKSGMLKNVVFEEPPVLQPVPKHRWLMQVYCQDVLHRLDEIKASITSVFGNILKIDSTKKIVRKLSGRAQGTAVWCTNIGNEYGQVLSSVMTAAEGSGIAPLIDGIMCRYQRADVQPPAIVYTDRDCCGGASLPRLLSAWDSTVVRLDIWHFMRRLSTGLTTDSHQLYGSFMDSLSNCIFEWDKADLNRLMLAKCDILESQSGQPVSESDVKRQTSRKELSRHCQRRTRGEATTTDLIDGLINSYSGPGGCDSLGVPLIDKTRMKHIWMQQKKHVRCIQDPPGTQLYTQTGSIKKGNHVLPIYRCSRGSTSLESFHLHLNRFVPGTLASDVHFQAYLLDGVFRWNKDRAETAVAGDETEHHTYSGALQYAVNTLGETVLGRKICPSYRVPLKYTGELLGIEYLYNQTGKVMEDYKMTISDRETEGDNVPEVDDGYEDEGLGEEVDDLTVPLLEKLEPYQCSQPTDEPTLLQRHTLLSTPAPQPRRASPPRPTHTQVSSRKAERFPIDSPTRLLENIQSYQPSQHTDEPALVRKPTKEPTLIQSPTNEPALIQKPLQQIRASPPRPTHTKISQRKVEQAPMDSPSQLQMLQETPKMNQLPLRLDPQLDSFAPVVVKPTSPVPICQPDRTEETVDSQNRPGLQEVTDLAVYLTSVRDCDALTKAQAAQITALWNKLHQLDRQPTAFPPKFAKVSKGRFRATKKVQNVVEGVESTKRCFLGPNQGPAQWPDCNRYTEAVIIQLLRIFPRDIRKSSERMTRFGLVLSAYRRIRECVLNNHIVMRDTQIQLPDINKGTLTQWFTKRAKAMDRRVLLQGVNFQQPDEVSPGTPLQPLLKPSVLPAGKGEQHTFQLPEDTAGSAKLKRRRTGTHTEPTGETTGDTFVIFEGKAFPISSLNPSNQTLVPNVVASEFPAPEHSSIPYTTQRYRQKKMDDLSAGITKRQYHRRKTSTICKKCGQDRNSGGHELYKQYFSNRFCPITSSVSYEEWLDDLKTKQYGKKRKLEYSLE